MAVKINKRKSDGQYYCFISKYGKRIGRAVGYDHREAKKKAAQYQYELDHGLIDFGSRTHKKASTFAELAKHYLKEQKHRGRLKPSSIHGYEQLIEKHLLPSWGTRHIDELTKDDVRKLLDIRRSKGRDSNNLRVCISAVLQFAVDSDLLKMNVARDLGKMYSHKRSKNGLSQKQIKFLKKPQIAQLLATAQKQKPKYHDFILLLFRTGLRLGEAVALAWDCVDFDTRQIKVRRNYIKNYTKNDTKKNWQTPKNYKSRFVPMSDNLVEVLQQRQKQREQKQPVCPSYKKLKTGEDIKLVFAKSNGDVINGDWFRIQFKKLLKAAELPNCRIQDARHTFASLLLQAGTPIIKVSRFLGHATINITCDIYGHLDNEATSDIVNILD